ncbi:MAG: hypothetical protein WB902_05955, partial [Acetobacteraceae bacterium]
ALNSPDQAIDLCIVQKEDAEPSRVRTLFLGWRTVGDCNDTLMVGLDFPGVNKPQERVVYLEPTGPTGNVGRQSLAFGKQVKVGPKPIVDIPAMSLQILCAQSDEAIR